MVNCLEYDPYTIYPFQLQWNLYSGDTQGPGQVSPKKRLEFVNNLPQKIIICIILWQKNLCHQMMCIVKKVILWKLSSLWLVYTLGSVTFLLVEVSPWMGVKSGFRTQKKCSNPLNRGVSSKEVMDTKILLNIFLGPKFVFPEWGVNNIIIKNTEMIK